MSERPNAFRARGHRADFGFLFQLQDLRPRVSVGRGNFDAEHVTARKIF